MSFTLRRDPSPGIVCDQCGYRLPAGTRREYSSWWSSREPPHRWGREPGDGSRHACPDCIDELRSRLGAVPCARCRGRAQTSARHDGDCEPCGGSGWAVPRG